MKRILSIILVMLLLLSAGITVFAENVSDIEDPVAGGGPEDLPQITPDWIVLQNVSVTFYILAGRADVSYTVSSKSPKIEVKIEIYKNGLFPKTVTERVFTSQNKNFVSGSLTVPITEDGTYTAKITFISGSDKKILKNEYTYRASDCLGDVNFNGKIQADDARRILRYAAKIDRINNEMKSVCDVDSNGHVNAADARIVLRCAARL